MFDFLKKIKISAFKDKKADIQIDVINTMYTIELLVSEETTVEEVIHELNRVLADRFFSFFLRLKSAFFLPFT